MRTALASIITLALVCTAVTSVVAQEAEGEAAPEPVSWFAQTMPVEGTLVGDHWVDTEAPGCAPGSAWRFGSEGSGQIVGVGDVDFVLTQCAVWDMETNTGTYGEGTVTFTTADGDTLEIAQVGHGGGVPGVEAGSLIGWTMGGTWEAVGGTGRFEGASGYGWLAGVGDIGYDALYGFHGYLASDA
jgi:hypothetical protein